MLLGTGDGKYEQSVKIINDMGFEGWLMTENYYYLPPMNDGEADFIALASCDLETMKKVLKRMAAALAATSDVYIKLSYVFIFLFRFA